MVDYERRKRSKMTINNESMDNHSSFHKISKDHISPKLLLTNKVWLDDH